MSSEKKSFAENAAGGKVPPDIRKLRKELHSCPELSLREQKTRRVLLAFLNGLQGIEVEERGAWFCAVRKSSREAMPPIAFRADFDAVAGADGRPGHYCGHDGHASILAGFAEYLSVIDPDRTVYLIFQPAEETGEGALLCRELLKEKGITEIYGFHNIPGYETGSVLILPGTFACASTGLEITVSGTPSHAAYPEAGKNPAELLAQLILYRKELLEKPCEGMVLATVVGAELGGPAYGVSAGHGVLRLTLRAELQSEFQSIVKSYTEKAMQLSDAAGMQCSVRRIEEFPATENHADCAEKVEAAAKNLGLRILHPAEPFRWSEDFGYYLRETKGAFFGVGAGREWPQLHTAEYEFPDEIAETVLRVYAELIKINC